jgi:hypothetical protein
MNPCFAINPRSEHSGADAGKRGGLSFLICRRSASGGRSGSSCWNACQKMLHGLSVPAWLISDLVQVWSVLCLIIFRMEELRLLYTL